MNKRWWLLVIFLAWIGAGYAVFSGQKSRNRVLRTSSGRVDRIVSMAPNLTEILFALGLDERVVGVTSDSDYPAAAQSKAKVGTFWQPNIEAVIAARPELTVTLGFEQQKNLAERLNRIGYRCLTLSIEGVDELFEAIHTIGQATGAGREADGLSAEIRENLDRLETLVGTYDRVKVLWVVQREPLRVAGRDTFVNELIEMAGGENAIGPTIHKYPPIGAEQVIACQPEVIIEPTMSGGDLTRQRDRALQYWSKLINVPAIANKQIYVIDGGLVSRLGPRLYEATEVVARCLRPGLFDK